MIIESKAWDWSIVPQGEDDFWMRPADEMFGLINRWKSQNKKDFLDLGAGLGRHALLFAKAGFHVGAMDLSKVSVAKLDELSKKEGLEITAKVGDMLDLPFVEDSFDCLLAFHVISHTNTEGMYKVANELHRVLRGGGEFYLTLGDKRAWGWTETDWPKTDENTKLRMEEGPEYKIPHFYADYDLIFDIFKDFEILSVTEKQDHTIKNGYRNTDKYGLSQSGWHWYVLGRKK